MRQLRFVRTADDGTHVVVETADGGERFGLALDTALRDAARADLPRLPSAPDEGDAALGPREIQMRVRAGESPQEVAETNQMTLERVLRFAGPVLDERGRIADEARRARARRSTTEGQTVVFGEAVDERFAAHGIDPSAVHWDARRREDGAWIISAGWHGGEADRLAEWTLQLGTRTVTPLDDTAADLLSDRPIHQLVRASTAPQSNLQSAPPLARGVVAFPVMPDARTGPIPVIDDVFDQDAQGPGTRGNGASRGVPAARGQGRGRGAEPRVDARPAEAGQEPRAEATSEHETLPLDLPERARAVPHVKNLGVAQRSEESEEDRAERARIPSWDDILLGVRRKRD